MNIGYVYLAIFFLCFPQQTHTILKMSCMWNTLRAAILYYRDKIRSHHKQLDSLFYYCYCSFSIGALFCLFLLPVFFLFLRILWLMLRNVSFYSPACFILSDTSQSSVTDPCLLETCWDTINGYIFVWMDGFQLDHAKHRVYSFHFVHLEEKYASLSV